jgi:hypothetical protein
MKRHGGFDLPVPHRPIRDPLQPPEYLLRALAQHSKCTKVTPAWPQKKAKTIKQALDHLPVYSCALALDLRLNPGDDPVSVDTMGCETAKWKDSDPHVRLPPLLFTLKLAVAVFSLVHVASQIKVEVADAAFEKLRSALGFTLSLGALFLLTRGGCQPRTTLARKGFWYRKDTVSLF